jgi:hypothetical protein
VWEIDRDPAVGRAEWLAEWREDLASYIDRALIEAAVDSGVVVRPRIPNVTYHFCDPSGGSADSMVLAIAHREGETVILDCLVEKPAPFNAAAVTSEMAKTLGEYRLTECRGDRYGAQWVVQSFAANGITIVIVTAIARASTRTQCRCSRLAGRAFWTIESSLGNSRHWSGEQLQHEIRSTIRGAHETTLQTRLQVPLSLPPIEGMK